MSDQLELHAESRTDDAGSANPLDQLAEGMRNVANGRFDTRLEEQPEEPYRNLFRDFNQMTESLLGVEALRESFVSNVAHEFKTPLSYIQGYATLLQDDSLPPGKRDTYITNISNATQRLSNIINDLLEISNLSRPSAQLETQPFSLDEQLRHITAHFIPQIERKSLSYDITLESVDIDANASLLEDVWTNLLSNALKYTDDGGSLLITLVQQDGQAIVKVADTGCGMSEDQVKHAFDRFYHGEEPSIQKGNGLGLAIVKSVVKKHNGTVSVESELDHGTTFTIILPLQQH